MYPAYNEIRATSDLYDLVPEYCILNQKMDIAHYSNIFSESVLIVKEIGKIISFHLCAYRDVIKILKVLLRKI